MKMSGFVGVLAWLSSFALVWAIVLTERLQNSQAVAALLVFIAVALISSSIHSGKKESK